MNNINGAYTATPLCVTHRGAFGQARKVGKLRRAEHWGGGASPTVFVRWRDFDLRLVLAGGRCARHCTGRELLVKQAPERERTMKALVLATALLMACGSAYADSCKVEAGNKKLAGAAMTSFMKKCETDAKAACSQISSREKIGRCREGQLHQEMRHRRDW